MYEKLIEELVWKFVSNSSDYTFDYHGYRLPINIETVKGKVWDVKKNGIEKQIKQADHCSTWVPKFIKELDYLNKGNKDEKNKWYYVREFPVFIDPYRDIWNSFCDRHGIQEDGVRNKNCVFIDHYFPGSNVVVELDAPSTHGSPEQILADEVKDDFIEFVLGVRPLRFNRFGKDITETRKYMGLLKSSIDSGSKRYVDFSYKSVEYYKELYKDSYPIFTWLFEKIMKKDPGIIARKGIVTVKRKMILDHIGPGGKLNPKELCGIFLDVVGITLKIPANP